MEREPELMYLRDRAVRLLNSTCPYCGAELTPSNRTEDHTIGRRFVPQGSLNNGFNLIVGACGPCNGRKAGLENDLSAIAMYSPSADDALRKEIERKSRGSVSRRTGKPVAESIEVVKLTVPLFPNSGSTPTATFTLTAPPQASEDRIYDLCEMQISAFWYYVTYNRVTRRSSAPKLDFIPIMTSRREDWGNVINRAFMHTVHAWEPRLLANAAASRYFKLALRKHPAELCWSWALEWNQNIRSIGFVGNANVAHTITSTFPALQVHGNHSFRFRAEVPLGDGDDVMFDLLQSADSACGSRGAAEVEG